MKTINNTPFAAGLFGGFTWSSLSQDWEVKGTITKTTRSVAQETELLTRSGFEGLIKSSLSPSIGGEVGAQIGLVFPYIKTYLRAGYSLVRGRTRANELFSDRSRTTYFNGVVLGGGVDIALNKEFFVGLSCDLLQYGPRDVLNFDKVVRWEKKVETNHGFFYRTQLRSRIKPSSLRFMISFKYIVSMPSHEYDDF
jgi:opacity protein-like surface antigen